MVTWISNLNFLIDLLENLGSEYKVMDTMFHGNKKLTIKRETPMTLGEYGRDQVVELSVQKRLSCFEVF